MTDGPDITCACCGRTGPHIGRGLIRTCHTRHSANGTLHRWPLNPHRAPNGTTTYQLRSPTALGRAEDYAELRSQGLTRVEAAERLGVTIRTASRYQAYLRATQQEQEHTAA
ncbi:ribosomal protein L13E [Lipingzhangella halophila]|uniref:Ribosomal protein L13E n=1 Tax=Lipingzhangella halophila TaxID=1783352 RepID=A0A7W7RQB3_9ACTN|nr:helix-turn-helix transcriptional regulator [Lipingzhangella halophila]MBB4935678.1 ribosomal protein L13E [Lipingzhangella halophila]